MTRDGFTKVKISLVQRVVHICLIQPLKAQIIVYLMMYGMVPDYINGFLDIEYPYFDPKHGFLSSVEANKLLPKKAAICIYGILRPSFDF